MSDIEPFALVVTLVSAAGLLAVWSNWVSARVRLPTPAIFLVGAAAASDLVPPLRHLPVLTVQRVVTVMLVLLLFDGGMHIGWGRLRTVGASILWLGTVGTVVTTVGIGVLAHWAFGLDRQAASLIGVALAPTDPAVVFSVLGRREIVGRSGTLLEGESGANDPVGIAIMAAVLGSIGASGGAGGWHAVGVGAGQFVVQMAVGGLVGTVGGALLARLMHGMPLPSGALYPLQTLLVAGIVFGTATVLHGSGFLAVFVTGIFVGDLRAPYKRDIESFHASLASVAEIVAFTVLGLTVSIAALVRDGSVVTGTVLAVLIAVVVRPLLVGAILLPVSLTRGERLFVLWSGLKGAVPILLGTYVLDAHVAGAHRLYDLVVVVVAFSVVVQGGLVPTVARRLGVPMRVVEPEPWALGMRFRERPDGLSRCHVEPGSPADGTRLRDLPIGESSWISMINRAGLLVPVRSRTRLEVGDEVLLLADPDDLHRSRSAFLAPTGEVAGPVLPEPDGRPAG